MVVVRDKECLAGLVNGLCKLPHGAHGSMTLALSFAAAGLWRGQRAVDGSLAVSITHLFDRAELDVDNMPKPILDALKGLVYSDDAAVTDLTCRKRNLKDDPQISNASPILRQSLNSNAEFVHVLIDDAPLREVNFLWKT